ncbi:flagellar hook-length control protein FliK [Acidithrix sp. C25]|uniref:flagellar hook-length control protein FliK n=1 Tax=Acidithrix sp. C25 TaxID=1671482 RepID=UPI00191B91B5|nr:flagellar hook-length control protein FliK [Acidithrix sp. C25]CAG4933344.1 unnamed protein product [Acidithrix sp. C25]
MISVSASNSSSSSTVSSTPNSNGSSSSGGSSFLDAISQATSPPNAATSNAASSSSSQTISRVSDTIGQGASASQTNMSTPTSSQSQDATSKSPAAANSSSNGVNNGPKGAAISTVMLTDVSVANGTGPATNPSLASVVSDAKNAYLANSNSQPITTIGAPLDKQPTKTTTTTATKSKSKPISSPGNSIGSPAQSTTVPNQILSNQLAPITIALSASNLSSKVASSSTNGQSVQSASKQGASVSLVSASVSESALLPNQLGNKSSTAAAPEATASNKAIQNSNSPTFVLGENLAKTVPNQTQDASSVSQPLSSSQSQQEASSKGAAPIDFTSAVMSGSKMTSSSAQIGGSGASGISSTLVGEATKAAASQSHTSGNLTPGTQNQPSVATVGPSEEKLASLLANFGTIASNDPTSGAPKTLTISFPTPLAPSEAISSAIATLGIKAGMGANVELIITPPNLGPITAHMTIDSGGLVVSLTSSNSATNSLLLRHAGQLTSELTSASGLSTHLDFSQNRSFGQRSPTPSAFSPTAATAVLDGPIENQQPSPASLSSVLISGYHVLDMRL